MRLQWSLAGRSLHPRALVIPKRLRHSRQPVLGWMADTVSVKQDPAGNLKPGKAKSTGRIDGIVALIIALGRPMVVRTVEPRMGTIE